MLFLLAAPLVACGGTTVVQSTDCQTACEQANQCLGSVDKCASRCGVRAGLDMAAGCSDVDSAELAGFDTAVMGVSSVPTACSDLCPSCPAQETAWMACAKAYCDAMPYTKACKLSGIP
jgi:hypothetical protein